MKLVLKRFFFFNIEREAIRVEVHPEGVIVVNLLSCGYCSKTFLFLHQQMRTFSTRRTEKLLFGLLDCLLDNLLFLAIA